MNLLDLVIALPALGFLVMLLIPRAMDNAIRVFSLGFSLVTFVVSTSLIIGFQAGQTGQQFVTNVVWIQSPEIHYHVGVDGLSLWLIILSTFLTPISILLSWNSIKDRSKEYFAFLLLL